ncbi:MAG: hypothetical protein QM500_12110 [Methylococcales bacterium]
MNINEHKKSTETETLAGQNERLAIEQIECCKCGWVGDENDMKKTPSPTLIKLGVKGSDNVCPKCEHNEFYRL